MKIYFITIGIIAFFNAILSVSEITKLDSQENHATSSLGISNDLEACSVNFESTEFFGPIVTIYFGRKPYPDCPGFNFCKMKIEPKLQKEDKAMPVEVYIENGILHMVFSKENIPNTLMQNVFRKNVFSLTETYEVEKEVCTLIGLKSYFIKAGNYKIKSTLSNYIISFDNSINRPRVDIK